MVEFSSDHDLLVRIDEQMKQLRTALDVERVSATARETKQDVRIDHAEKDIESLRISRAQFYAVSATIAAIVTTLLKVFWK